MGLLSWLTGRREEEPKASSEDDLERICWKPQIEERDPGETLSRFSGDAVLPPGTKWPECARCQQPMQLFVQLDSRELPPQTNAPFGAGLLQLFYCTNRERMCEEASESWRAFSPGAVVRVLPLTDSMSLASNPVADAFPAKAIVGWAAEADYPCWEEVEQLGRTMSAEKIQARVDAGFPRSGDKLLGWPAWEQSVRYPRCPSCKKPMRYVFQIDSRDNLPHMFGDAGCGHVTQCSEHHEQVTFAWECG